MKNIPIYRAKKIDSDGYVIGTLRTYLSSDFKKHLLLIDTIEVEKDDTKSYFIHPSTLAIHLPQLGLLSKDNEKWFVSISQNGKGSDIFEVNDKHKTKLYGYLTDRGVYLTNSDGVIAPFVEYKQYLSVVGVKE